MVYRFTQMMSAYNESCYSVDLLCSDNDDLEYDPLKKWRYLLSSCLETANDKWYHIIYYERERDQKRMENMWKK